MPPSGPTFPVPSGKTAQVRIIDSTARLGNIPVSYLMQPPMQNLSHMPTLPSWSFLVESSSGKKALFDLGVPKDVMSMAPAVADSLRNQGWEIDIAEEVIDILHRQGISAEEIDSIVWSHWHWDHIGDPSRFPSSTEVVVGPGFKKAFLPGFPAKQDAPVRESDFRGRVLREIDYDNDPGVVTVGDFHALDFFGDGSFYLLDTPGHAIGHLGGLARTTTNPDTFIFMGGDLCHHSGEIRPSRHLSLPKEVPLPSASIPCPGAIFEQLLTTRARNVNEPFFDPVLAIDVPLAIDTIRKAQEADGLDSVWFVYAHDPSLMGVADLFPLSANEWKKRGWREKTLWTFLRDFEPATRAITNQL